MKILGIDTSCDDTCIALLEIRKCLKLEILSNVISSQVKLHAKYGGVWPFLAKREHQKNLPLVFKKATEGIDISKIDLVGVTIGPGLEPCLWQGVNFAKKLAEKLKKPIIPINHIEAHILANWLSPNLYISDDRFLFTNNIFPAICLVVSGGHTQLILMENFGKYKILGETRDDAAGECFDKVARILGLGYPGGPAIAEQARRWKFEIRNSTTAHFQWAGSPSPSLRAVAKFETELPRPMIYQKNYDFSFSGLKTAVLYDFRNRSPKIRKSKEYIRAMCTEVQQAIIDVLIYKTLKAARNYNTKSIILGGGVAANDELRKQFKSNVKYQISNVKFSVPQKIFCTDNAAMVAVTAYFHQKEATRDFKKIKANANLKI